MWSNYYKTYSVNKSSENLNDSLEPIIIYLEVKQPDTSWWKPSFSYFGNTICQIRIINNSADSIIIVKPEGYLSLALQAFKDSQWIMIESILYPECGWSYRARFNDTLKPNYEIQTYAELYDGDINTKYRLIFCPNVKMPQRKYYYSNEIPGKIEKCKLH